MLAAICATRSGGVVGADCTHGFTFGSYDRTLALDAPGGPPGVGPGETDTLALGPKRLEP